MEHNLEKDRVKVLVGYRVIASHIKDGKITDVGVAIFDGCKVFKSVKILNQEHLDVLYLIERAMDVNPLPLTSKARLSSKNGNTYIIQIVAEYRHLGSNRGLRIDDNVLILELWELSAEGESWETRVRFEILGTEISVEGNPQSLHLLGDLTSKALEVIQSGKKETIYHEIWNKFEVIYFYERM